MTYIRYIPSPPLNAYIDDLYYLDGPAPYPRQKVLPVASSNLMINLGCTFDVYEPVQDEPEYEIILQVLRDVRDAEERNDD